MERTGKELLIASKAFAEESKARSWWVLLSTIAVLVGVELVACAAVVPLAVSIIASVVAGLLMVRMFIIYHDFVHGAILKNDKIAYGIMYLYGLLILSPATFWKHNHDTHHKTNCDGFGAELGEFPIMTTVDYAKATFWERLSYRIVRNPMIIALGYITSFMLSTLKEFSDDPKKNYEGALSLLAHFSLAVIVGMFSIKALLLGMIIPIMIGAAMGTYMFYAQHNFPGMKRKEGQEWDYVYAALCSSSFMKMSPLMHWFTGNIGYHHVHHLNSKIPFYRLPEAMNAIEELQSPVATSLSPVDIVRCLRLKLWDPTEERLMTFREAKTQAQAA